MKIHEIKCLSNKQYMCNYYNQKSNKDNKFIKNNVIYNPVYYKPHNLSFKGKVFDSYFPSDILGMDEEDFDKLILKIIQDKDTRKRDALANYIVKTVAKKANAMDFVNMWKRQVPTLVTPGMISIGGRSNSAAISKALNIAARSSSNSMLDKFYASDFQTDVLIKDGKNAAGGLLAYKLYAMASADPEPYSKAALYAAGLAVSVGAYSLNRKESKKIQDQQFLNATKECMRLGALDPYLLLGKIDKTLVRGVNESDYKNWLDSRIENLRMVKTGSKIDKTGDFDYESAQKVLNKILFVMSSELNINDEKIVDFLNLVGAVYKSSHETADAYYIIDKARKIQENMFDNDKDKYLSYKPLYNTYTELADLQKSQEEYVNAINSLLQAEKVAINCYGENSQQVLDTNLRILDYIQERKIYNDSILPFIEAESDVSQNTGRKSYHEDMTEGLKEYNTDETGSFRIENLDNSKYNKKDSPVRVLNRILKLIDKNPKFASQIDSLFEIVNKYPNRKLYTTLMSNALILNRDSNLPEVAKSHLPVLYKSMGIGNQDTAQTVGKIFLYNMLAGKSDFGQIAKKLSKTYGSNPKNEAEMYHLVSSNTDYSEIEKNIFNISSGKNIDECVKFDKEWGEYVTDYSQYPDEYIEFQKILYNWAHSFDFIRPCYDLNLTCPNPDYTEKLTYRLNILEEKYGYNNDKTMQALLDCLKSPMYYGKLASLVSDFVQNANCEMKKKYSSQIFEAHADNIFFCMKKQYERHIDEDMVREGFLAYKKAIESSNPTNPKLIYKYLNYIDFSIKNKNDISSSYGSIEYESPLTKNIKSSKEENYEKWLLGYGRYRSWMPLEDKLKELVKSYPGPFRINERKYLQMQKKYGNAFFQNRFIRQIENQIAQIESTIGQFEKK